MHSLFLHAVLTQQFQCAATTPSGAAVPPPPSPNSPISPHLGLSPSSAIMLTCPFLVVSFSTQHSPQSLTGAHNIFCQDVSACTSCVTALGQVIAAEGEKRQQKDMQRSEHARFSLNYGVRPGLLSTELLVSRRGFIFKKREPQHRY